MGLLTRGSQFAGRGSTDVALSALCVMNGMFLSVTSLFTFAEVRDALDDI